MTITRKTLTVSLTAAAGSVALACAVVAMASNSATHEDSRRSSTAAVNDSRPELRNAGAAPTDTVAAGTTFVGVVLPEQAIDVAAPQAGQVKAVHVALGEVVEAGQTLVSLSVEQANLELNRAVAEREAARAALQHARIEHAHDVEESQRSEQLAHEGLATAAQLAEARFKLSSARALTAEAEARLAERSARAQQLAALRDQASVAASFRGRVAARYVQAGSLVAAGAPLLRLISDDAVLLRFAIGEELTPLPLGSQVEIIPDELPGAPLRAKVVRVSPEIDGASRMRALEAVPLDPNRVVTLGLLGAMVRVRARAESEP